MTNDPGQILHHCLRRSRKRGQNTAYFTALQRNYLLFVLLSGVVVFKIGQLSNSSASKRPRKDKMACNIPVLNPFDKSMLPYNVIFQPPNCTAGHPNIFKTDLESNLLQMEDPSNYGYFNCCYQNFIRGASVTMIELVGKCIPINIKEREIKIPEEMDFIRIDCSVIKNNISAFKTVDLFGFVHLKQSVEERAGKLIAIKGSIESRPLNGIAEAAVVDSITVKNDAIPDRKLNVVILGIDSVSHMNFIRTMPLVHAYLMNNLSAIGLDGYVKVDENTFPNLMPVLTGQSEDELTYGCWKEKTLDNCDFIWKTFADKGYRTAYGDDAIWMSMVMYNKHGLKDIPTDYYYPPLTHQLEKCVGHQRRVLTALCYGSVLGFEVSLDFLQKMAFTMNKTRRYFQFSWTTGLTHDYLNAAKLGDKPLFETLKWFRNEGYLEDTVLVLLSDNGLGWGNQTSTLQGKLEERMPLLYFVFPDWFKEKYRPAVSNLLRNMNRLTTPFDLHETLRDLADLANISRGRVRDRQDELSKQDKIPRGISLFLPIPLHRNCLDAEILEHYCVCRAVKSIEVENNTLIDEAARSVVDHINDMFIRSPQCMTLSLRGIISAQVFHSSNSGVEDVSENITRSDDPLLKSQEVTYGLSFSVLPSNASFEATTTHLMDGTWRVSREISRTNIYGNQSICVAEHDLKKFCFCR
ncbi:unnamed protein product [Allacma fusca]|uniref:Uncharacterized protein n=1 Tax=Allacma fusca TaxID=39272 RepID=A0A8J2NS33_9HEXA|nr:unnamed protein product [Allacma fusca]